jgi:hypothetical protein
VSDLDTAGSFSGFFGPDPTEREPKRLFNSWISASARQVEADAAATYRLILTDLGGNRAATDEIPLSTTFERTWVPSAEFTNPIESSGVDLFNIVGVSLALFTTPGSDTPSRTLRVDDVSIEFVPEPGAVQLGAVAIVAVVMAARRRRGPA